MKTSSILLGLAIVLATTQSMAAPSGAAGVGGNAALSGPNLKEPPSVVYQTSFEKSEQPWSAGTNDRSATAAVSRQTGDNGCGDGGQAYAALQSHSPDPDNKLAESTLPMRTWAAIALSGPAGPVDVAVAWSARNLSGCEGCIPALFVSTQAPDDTVHFQMALPALSSQWQNRSQHATLLYGNTGTIYVALGWMGSNASVALDCVNISITAHYDYTFEFENGVEPWQAVELEGEGATLDQSLGNAGCARGFDTWHAALRNYWGPGQGSPGAVPAVPADPAVPIPPYRLMQATFPPSGDKASDVTVTWSARNEYGCAGCTPLVYVGTAPLTTRGQLQPLAARFGDYWQRMGYWTSISTLAGSNVYVVLGWEEPQGANPPRAAGFDCLNVRIEPSDVYP